MVTPALSTLVIILGPAIFAPGLLGSLGVRPYKAAGSGGTHEKITSAIHAAEKRDKILFIILIYIAKISFSPNKRILLCNYFKILSKTLVTSSTFFTFSFRIINWFPSLDCFSFKVASIGLDVR